MRSDEDGAAGDPSDAVSSMSVIESGFESRAGVGPMVGDESIGDEEGTSSNSNSLGGADRNMVMHCTLQLSPVLTRPRIRVYDVEHPLTPFAGSQCPHDEEQCNNACTDELPSEPLLSLAAAIYELVTGLAAREAGKDIESVGVPHAGRGGAVGMGERCRSYV